MDKEVLKALAIETLKAESITATMDAVKAWMIGYQVHAKEELTREADTTT